VTLARTRDLPPDIADLLHRGDGLIDVASAKDAIVGIDRLLRLAETGDLVRVGTGVYASARHLDRCDEWEQHLLRARAFALSCGPDAMLTGWSAARAWELPTIGAAPDLACVVRPKVRGLGATRTLRGRVLVANVPESHRCRTAGTRLVSQAWTAADVSRTAPIPAALAVADAVARAGFDIAEAITHMSHWCGVGRARWVADHADPLAESPLETLGRFTCIEFDLPLPVSNAWVGDQRPAYRVDGLWPFHGVVHEADGALKYDNRPDAASIVTKQREREWELRQLFGLDVVRYGWDLAVHRRHELARRFAARLSHGQRSTPVRWWKHVPGVGPVEPEPGDWPSPHPPSIVLPAGWRDPHGRS
jgi:hypothetical protein